MTINDVRITNMNMPGGKFAGDWWAAVKAEPKKPLIQATISMTLSWEEYQELLDKDDGGNSGVTFGYDAP